MLSEIVKDARAIAALQKEVQELREKGVSNMRCIVALDEEMRLLKAQQTKDYTHLVSMSTHQTESQGQQETILLALRKEVQDQTKRSTVFEKETRVCLDRIVSPAIKPFVVDAVTGEKVLLLPLEGCPNVFILQAKAVKHTMSYRSTHPLAKQNFYSERPCWVISINHWYSTLGPFEDWVSEHKIDIRPTVRSFLFKNMETMSVETATDFLLTTYGIRDGKFAACVIRKFVTPYNFFQIFHDYGICAPLMDAFQPTLIEFVP